MKTSKRRSFRRRVEIREYRPVFLIATEGRQTEPQYFGMEIFRDRPVALKILRTNKQSSPEDVLERIKSTLKKYRPLRKKDKAWIVIDHDGRKKETIEILYSWALEDEKRGIAVSNPKFEYWLLLHFENGDGISNDEELMNRLKKHLPDYEKGDIQVNRFSLEKVKIAVKRASSKDRPKSQKCPPAFVTTIYRVIDLILTVE